jgi:alpha-tubulin suppressor-like RCC1 family protein
MEEKKMFKTVQRFCAVLLVMALLFSMPLSAAAAEATAKPYKTVVSTGDSFFVILEDNSLCVWGENDYGQLGDGTKTAREKPAKLMNDVAFVCSDGRSTFVVKTDGSLWGWGSNIGFGYDNLTLSPVKLTTGVSSVYNGGGQAARFIIKTDGSLWSWGMNNTGTIGNGTKDGKFYQNPVKIMDNVATVAPGDSLSFAVTKDGTLYGWGTQTQEVTYPPEGKTDYDSKEAVTVLERDLYLGDGTMEDRLRPIKLMDNVASVIHDSHNATYALKTDGTVWGWGYDNFGTGTVTLRERPAQVSGIDNVASISSFAAGVVLALKKNGELWGWGNTSCMGVGATLSNQGGMRPSGDNVAVRKLMDNVACADANLVSLVVKTDGSVWRFGNGPKSIGYIATPQNVLNGAKV